jgi:hypothetical protein
MEQPATTGKASGTTRLDRRKARTRQALIDAAARLIAEGRGERASIQEITEAADIGFGSFYNHPPRTGPPAPRRCGSAASSRRRPRKCSVSSTIKASTNAIAWS